VTLKFVCHIVTEEIKRGTLVLGVQVCLYSDIRVTNHCTKAVKRQMQLPVWSEDTLIKRNLCFHRPTKLTSDLTIDQVYCMCSGLFYNWTVYRNSSLKSVQWIRSSAVLINTTTIQRHGQLKAYYIRTVLNEWMIYWTTNEHPPGHAGSKTEH